MGDEQQPQKVSIGTTLSLDEVADIQQARGWDRYIIDNIEDAHMAEHDREKEHQGFKVNEYYLPKYSFIAAQELEEEEQLRPVVEECLDEEAETDRASLIKLDSKLRGETDWLIYRGVEQETELYMRRFYWKDNVPKLKFTDPSPDELVSVPT